MGRCVEAITHTRCSRRWPLRSLALGLAALGAALIFPWTAEAAPSLTLSPSQAACSQPNFPVTIRGEGFPSGQALEIYDFDAGTQSRPGIGVRAGTATVGTDGAFTAVVRLMNCGPGTPGGTQFTLAAFRQGETSGGLPAALASAVFTAQAPPGLPNTGGGARQAPSLAVVLVSAAAFVASGTALLTHRRPRRP